MSRANRKQVMDTLHILKKASGLMKKLMKQQKKSDILNLLVECQDCAIVIGNQIDVLWPEAQNCISVLEEYCETVYQLSITIEEIKEWEQHYRVSVRQLEAFEEAFEKAVSDKLEILFMPYKASMWDSLESIWRAAVEDEQCEVRVIPLPYYERNADGSLGMYHYEGDLFPSYVTITHYDAYDLNVKRPDAVYIHNPYDYANHVTSIDPRYYSTELKKYAKKLIYVPYYTTSGDMSKAQELCPAYVNADYIVTQAERYRSFFNSQLSNEKFLPFGSPKFDRVIKMCKNPPAPPIEWQKQMQGKKVYFYNTSINGMLADTRSFLLKMEYVFKTFQGREDSCLLWRPHPLLESTFDSMRKEYKPIYEELKHFFIQNGLGIYDDTPDVTETIAQCDAYIGDAGSSVVSLFGIAGKPVFILNNRIHSMPKCEDWRGEIVKSFYIHTQDEWMITQGNKLYYAPNHDYRYEYYCDLSEDAGGDYYCRAYERNEKIYVCPQNACNILVIEDRQIVKRIELKRYNMKKALFVDAIRIGHYLFLFPFYYPMMVRLDMETQTLDYIEVPQEFSMQMVRNKQKSGGRCAWKDCLLMTSTIGGKVLLLHSATLKMQVYEIKTSEIDGWCAIISEKENWYLLPCEGTIITCYNPLTNEVRDYDAMVEGIKCINPIYHYECMERPFASVVIYEKHMLLAPWWGNIFVDIDMESKETKKYYAPVGTEINNENGYIVSSGVGAIYTKDGAEKIRRHYYFDFLKRKLYEIDFKADIWNEIEISFDYEELAKHEPGFSRYSEWLRYGCVENAFVTLQDFIDDNVKGHAFDKEEQIKTYKEIAANSDGSCGEKVHRFICEQL